MNALVLALFGAAIGIGALLVAAGVMGVEVVNAAAIRDGRLGRYVDRTLLRASIAVVAGLMTLFATHWTVAVIVAAAGGWWSPTWYRSRGSYERELQVVEAIAAWTEQIRDTLAAANGLEHALGATASLAPAPIAGAVERLASRFDYDPLPDALRRFADEVDHPMADFVVAALVIAAEKQARDLGALLSQLAEAARDEARMRTRVWVGRARSRSAVRIIVVVVVSMVAGLLAFNRAYLEPYDSAGGQLVLAVIIVMFGASFVAMERLGRIAMPDRFVGRRAAGVARP
ncbi:MAG: type II secretion system F family protein [Ilumatobacteraceae bacterium]